jgi:hypothetical protein
VVKDTRSSDLGCDRDIFKPCWAKEDLLYEADGLHLREGSHEHGGLHSGSVARAGCAVVESYSTFCNKLGFSATKALTVLKLL